MFRNCRLSGEIVRGVIIFLLYAGGPGLYAQKAAGKKREAASAYLFVYFTGNGKQDESIHYGLSRDGYDWRALNGNQPVISSAAISSTGGVRDPHILRGHDGKTFYMVATDMESAKGWNSNRAMVLLRSTDLVTWTSSIVNIQKKFAGQEDLLRVWAPQTIYDQRKGKYMIYWSMKHGEQPDIIYYAYANKDFTDIEGEPKQLFFSPQHTSCIDADIVQQGSRFILFFKTEGTGNGIKRAISDHLTGGYVQEDRYLQPTGRPVEGSSVFRLNDGSGYIMMYDLYMDGRFQFSYSRHLDSFSITTRDVRMDFHPRHGTVLPITKTEADRLSSKWGRSEAAAKKWHNPVLKGYYADPEILYAVKTGKYYIYPTSDGFDNWSGNYFKVFSSADLGSWKDEGKILQLGKDVTWADRNAWAPCIIEKKTGGGYKYYYYFCAAQKIGVAVAEDPAGPFRDLGRPLIDQRPAGVHGGQEIDPDVFTDPATHRSYLYWGNGYMAVSALNEDMVSLQDSPKIITPDPSFREGTYVFYRKGKYYFLWSQNDTRDPDYGVRYGISDSPTGPVAIPPDNLILMKDDSAGIYGTGHNSVLQIPCRDEWYMVYHRFTYPNGIGMGQAAGYHREVCIDKMEFNDDGTIRKVIPTHRGVAGVR